MSTLTNGQAFECEVVINETELLESLKSMKNYQSQEMTELQKSCMNSFEMTLKFH